MNDDDFRLLLSYFNYSFSGYRKVRKGVKKRVGRHMQELGLADLSGYLELIDRDPRIKNACKLLMTVPISRFFRDRAIWKLLHEQVLPLLLREHPESVNAWSAGCARGEEAYSLSIVYQEIKKGTIDVPALNILATDINQENLERASEGLFLKSSLKELPESYTERYFDSKKSGKSFRVKDFLKERIKWKNHLLDCPPPARGFHLIFLRNNILTYYEKDKRLSAFKNVISALNNNGFLIIGSHESIPPEIDFLQPFRGSSHIFVKAAAETTFQA